MSGETKGEAADANPFFAKLSVLSNNSGGRIEEQIKQICKAAEQIEKYIEMLRRTGLNYTADSMARNTAEIKLRQNVILQIVEDIQQEQQQQQEAEAGRTTTGGAAVITMSGSMQPHQPLQQSQHQFVKRYARFRMRCPKCGHHKLRQVIEIASAPIYPEDIITTYPSCNYDYCEWCYYKKVETLGEN